MGRRPCCSKEGLNRGAWSAREDKILINYVDLHGEGKWRDLPQRAGLKRCGKSCRLRWLNYLRPDIKRGNISEDEEELIIRMHRLLGNRWSLIAGRLPGRTDNEIKNYWNTNLSKKVQEQRSGGSGRDNEKRSPNNDLEIEEDNVRPHEVIRTKAVRCTRVLIPLLKSDYENNQGVVELAAVAGETISLQSSPSCSSARPEESRGCLHPRSPDFLADFNVDDLLLSYAENPEMHFHGEQDHPHNFDIILDAVEDCKVDAKGLEGWGTDELFGSNGCFDFNALSSFLEEDNGSDSNEKDQVLS